MHDHQMRLRLARARNLTAIITADFSLQIRCREAKCGHTRVIDPKPFAALCRAKRWDPCLENLSNKMRCTKCGAKWPTLKPTRSPPNSPPIGPTNEEEYRRLVRRLRG